jgi:isopentenyldiphosphate isomerase
MSEVITTYEMRDPEIAIPMDRDEYYGQIIKEVEKSGKATKAVEIVAVLLFNHEREIILQKRSPSKIHNPFLIDKAIGGHIRYGDSPIYTVMVETVQELKVPSIVLRTEEDFKKTFILLRTYLEDVAIIKELDRQFFELERIINGVKYTIPHKVHLYIGVYGGSTKPSDKEASGVLYYNLDILKKEIAASPGSFTRDLSFYLEKYSKEIDDFLKHFD